jgi:mannobiose 2-epimerase
MLVSQTRHIWSCSKLAEFLNDDKYVDYAKTGFSFLRDKMYDSTSGGFYFLKNRTGNLLPNDLSTKTSYSNAFVIYALAAYYKISKDSSALNLAINNFYWLEKHAYDSLYKGYYNLLNRDGSLQKNTERNGLKYNIHPLWKDQNTSIHLLEAFTELYSVWPNSLLHERLEEMLFLIRDVITNSTGYLSLYLRKDWIPISFRDSTREVREANYYLDHVSFGHDVETAFLMLEASHELGIKEDIKTLLVAKKMVDHALDFGWDKQNGGFYYEGYYQNNSNTLEIIDSSKVWWVEAEGLNSLLLMSKLFPNEKKYYSSFIKQWDYIKKYLIDHKNKGWYINGLDKNPEMVTAPKAFDWKANYHTVRGMLNCILMLEELESKNLKTN